MLERKTTSIEEGINWARLNVSGKSRRFVVIAAEEIKRIAQSKLVYRQGKRGPGGRHTGKLADSITIAMSGDGLSASVGPTAKYAKYVEGYPRPPGKHFVPFSVAPGLKHWLKSKGIDVPASSKGWMVGGPQSSTPFMRPALKESQQSIKHNVKSRLRV